MSMLLSFGFVAAYLPIQFVSKFIDSSIQVSVRAFGKQITTLDMHIALGPLAFFLLCHVVHCQYYPYIDYLVEMPGNSIQFAHYVAAKCRGNLKVVTTNRQVHTETPFPQVGTD